MQEIYPHFIKFHIVFSVLFLITIVIITLQSLLGWIKRKEYGRRENRLRKTYLILLYIDLLIGIILYFFLQKPNDIFSTEEAMNFMSLRFWAIQHFSNIVFVVILCTTGNLLIKKTPKSSSKFKYSVFYFGISTIIIIISVGLFALRK
jgi:cytochrome bd-type quinol oxidase subunit 2